MTRRPTIALLLLVAAGVAGCVTTPLPLPPTMDPERLSLEEGESGTVVVRGAAGAARPGGIDLRVTAVEGPTWGTPPPFGEVRVEGDGSFELVVAGNMDDFFYFEAIEEEEDLFLLAVALVRGAGGVGEVDAGGDRDGDGSPDAIDCAPDDDLYGGQRCP